MRMEKTKKVMLNHAVPSDLDIAAHDSTDNAWVWTAYGTGV